jgi:hypothetical protein
MKFRFRSIFESGGPRYNTDISIQLPGSFNHDQHLRISRRKKDLLWYYKGPGLITNGLLQNLITSQRPKKIFMNENKALGRQKKSFRD